MDLKIEIAVRREIEIEVYIKTVEREIDVATTAIEGTMSRIEIEIGIEKEKEIELM